ncbi:helix-turn-helix transcriptional regulator [Pseudonocardia sp. TRM90224]|uniref:helix-turn-helix transcriptional regulator n=1 Tax=Pseudonocardia sp. TRM90224 TaxID=2812678 RepID=UPI001E584C34|nr:LuxR family transcriptional regulator [Pseudonocardia sp. TRM90224]
MTRAIRAMPACTSGITAGEWPFVGRDGEARAMAATLTRRMGAVLAAPTGAGRSRLVAEALGGRRGVVRIVATASAGAVPLGAFRPLFPRMSGPLNEQLGRMADALTGRDALTLCVDDAHLLDEASAALLHQVTLRCAGRSRTATVAVTLRSGAPSPDAVTALWKDGLLDRIDVAPLGAAAVRDLLEAVLGDQLERCAAHRLHDLTRGNMVLLRRLVHEEVVAGRLRPAAGVWQWFGGPKVSPLLAELVDAYLGPVPSGVRSVAELIAVDGVADLPALERIAGQGAVEQAESSGIVEITDGDGAAGLTLPLYGELLRARAGRARALRRRAAVLSIAAPAGDDDELRALCSAGMLDRAAEIAERETGPAEPTHAALVDIRRGLVALERGAVRTAARRLRDATAVLAVHGGNPAGWSGDEVALLLVRAAGALGDPSGVAAVPRSGLRMQRQLALAWAAAAAGAVSEAVAIANRAAVLARAAGDRWGEVDALHTAVRFGSAAGAERLDELAGELDGPRAASAAAHAAALAAGDGTALSAVSAAAERWGALLIAADASAQAAVAHHHRGDRTAAIAAAGRAAELAERCEGAVTPALRDAAHPLPLTSREREIVMLASAGLSNKKIAERLVVSVRTVEGHLYRACTKLHVSTRGALVDVLNEYQQA